MTKTHFTKIPLNKIFHIGVAFSVILSTLCALALAIYLWKMNQHSPDFMYLDINFVFIGIYSLVGAILCSSMYFLLPIRAGAEGILAGTKTSFKSQLVPWTSVENAIFVYVFGLLPSIELLCADNSRRWLLLPRSFSAFAEAVKASAAEGSPVWQFVDDTDAAAAFYRRAYWRVGIMVGSSLALLAATAWAQSAVYTAVVLAIMEALLESIR